MINSKFSKKTLIGVLVLVIMLYQVIAAVPCYSDDISYTKIAENQRFVLYVNPKYGYIKLYDKLSKTTWFSNPENWREDPIAAGSMRTQLASQLVIKYAYMESYSTQTANSYAGSAVKKGLKIQKIKNGYIVKYWFKKEGFEIPVEVTLNKDYLNVSILVNKIKETKTEKYRLVSIQLLPFFGAGNINDKGYIVVPDGCGAVINFNNRKGNEEYSQRVYGPDYSLVREPNVYVTQYARLPVFGIRKNNVAMLAIATKGDSKAIVNAYTSGSRNSYNQAYFEFIIREQDNLTFREKQWNERSFNVFEEGIPIYDKYSVRYYFLTPEKSDYVAMAEKYREYLVEEKGMRRVNQNKSPVYLEFYGAVKKIKYIVGLPRNVTIPLTTFKDAEEIVKQLKKIGINDIVIKFTGWYQNGVYYNMPLSIKPEKVLGGSSSLERMLNNFKKMGVKTYLDIDFITFRKGSMFYPVNSVATKSMKKTPAKLIRYSPATCYADEDYPVLFAASPVYVERFVDKFLKFEKSYIDSISISSLSRLLYSDFGAKKINRLKTEEIFESTIKGLQRKYKNLLLTEPNMYLVANSTEIVDVPIQSSKYVIEDYEIPFYQMVLRGYIPYSTPSINYYTADWLWKLKVLETGSYIKYTWTARNEDELKETLCDYLYSSNYKLWLSDTEKIYREIYPVLNLIRGKKFKSHMLIRNGVVKVEYEGGTQILINYTEKAQNIDGVIVEGRNFKVINKR